MKVISPGLIFWLILAVNCSSEKFPSAVDDSINSEVGSVEVKVQKVITSKLHRTIVATGKVAANNHVSIVSQTSGLVAKVFHANSDYVKKGETLIQFDQKIPEIMLEQAEISLKKAQINFESKKLDLLDSLFSNASEKNETIEKLKLQVGLKEAQLAHKKATIEFDNTSIIAPFNGRIVNMKVTEGQYLGQNENACQIYTSNELMVKSEVLESDLNYIQVGTPAKIEFIDNKITYGAVVSEINPIVNDDGMVSVKLSLQGTSKHMFPGMFVSVEFKVFLIEGIIIPKKSITLRSGRQVVFVAKNNEAHWKYIETGLENGDQIEVIKGLELGQKLITTNHIQLDQNSPILELEETKQ